MFHIFHPAINICLAYVNADEVRNIVPATSEILKSREWLSPYRSSIHWCNSQLYKLNIINIFKQLTLICTPITIFIGHTHCTIK